MKTLDLDVYLSSKLFATKQFIKENKQTNNAFIKNVVKTSLNNLIVAFAETSREDIHTLFFYNTFNDYTVGVPVSYTTPMLRILSGLPKKERNSIINGDAEQLTIEFLKGLEKYSKDIYLHSSLDWIR